MEFALKQLVMSEQENLAGKDLCLVVCHASQIAFFCGGSWPYLLMKCTGVSSKCQEFVISTHTCQIFVQIFHHSLPDQRFFLQFSADLSFFSEWCVSTKIINRSQSWTVDMLTFRWNNIWLCCWFLLFITTAVIDLSCNYDCFLSLLFVLSILGVHMEVISEWKCIKCEQSKQRIWI